MFSGFSFPILIWPQLRALSTRFDPTKKCHLLRKRASNGFRRRPNSMVRMSEHLPLAGDRSRMRERGRRLKGGDAWCSRIHEPKCFFFQLMDRRGTLEIHTSLTPSVSLTPQTKTAPPTATIPVAIAKAFAANIAEEEFTWDITFEDVLSGSAESVFSTDEVGREAGRRREDGAVRLGGGALRQARCLRSTSSGMARARVVPINCLLLLVIEVERAGDELRPRWKWGYCACVLWW